MFLSDAYDIISDKMVDQTIYTSVLGIYACGRLCLPFLPFGKMFVHGVLLYPICLMQTPTSSFRRNGIDLSLSLLERTCVILGLALSLLDEICPIRSSTSFLR